MFPSFLVWYFYVMYGQYQLIATGEEKIQVKIPSTEKVIIKKKEGFFIKAKLGLG